MIWPARQKHDVDCVLSTERLSLRPAVLSDYASWKAVRAANYDYLKQFEPAWPDGCLTEDFFRRRTERLSRDWIEDKTYAFLIWQDNNFIGGININNVTRGAAQYASLGYWLAEAHQGQGYMTEATKAVLVYAFDTISLSRMNAATLPHNEKSKAMLLRCGFTEEGFARRYIQIDGRRQDHILFGLNADDFRKI